MVTFADPRELRQALVEMDHHMVSSEMTAPEGGLASLVQHVLRVKLTEVCHTFMYSHRYFIYQSMPFGAKFRLLGTCTPTPPLSLHFLLTEK